jgi:hypothetical protein
MENVKGFYQQLGPVILKSKYKIINLSRETYASRVTIWRWINQINTNYPDPHKLVSVLSKISGKYDPKEIADHFGGEIKKFILGYFRE